MLRRDPPDRGGQSREAVVKCLFCGGKFSGYAELRSHQKESGHGKCQHCGRILASAKALSRHVKGQHMAAMMDVDGSDAFAAVSSKQVDQSEKKGKPRNRHRKAEGPTAGHDELTASTSTSAQPSTSSLSSVSAAATTAFVNQATQEVFFFLFCLVFACHRW